MEKPFNREEMLKNFTDAESLHRSDKTTSEEGALASAEMIINAITTLVYSFSRDDAPVSIIKNVNQTVEKDIRKK
jgi:hypothetical protein